MKEKFYTLITSIGKSKITKATAEGTKLNLTSFAVGDGNGDYYNPSEEQIALKREVWRGNISSIKQDKNNTNWIVAETILTSEVGDFIIREAGIFDEEGDLIAIGKYPESYKPILEDGSAKDLHLRMILEISNAASITLKVDPSIILVTKKDLEEAVKNSGGKTAVLYNYLKLTESKTSIPIGIPEYNYLEDDLELHINGRLLTENHNYRLSESKENIENIDSVVLWEANDEFDIKVLKHVKGEVKSIDPGLIPEKSIVQSKLSEDIQNKINSIEGKATKEELEEVSSALGEIVNDINEMDIQTATGTANAILLTGITTFQNNKKYSFLAKANSTGAVTINGKVLKKNATTQATTGDIKTEKVYDFYYDGTVDALFILAKASGNATIADVLAGKTFSNSDGTDLTGTFDLTKYKKVVIGSIYQNSMTTESYMWNIDIPINIDFEPKQVFLNIGCLFGNIPVGAQGHTKDIMVAKGDLLTNYPYVSDLGNADSRISFGLYRFSRTNISASVTQTRNNSPASNVWISGGGSIQYIILG